MSMIKLKDGLGGMTFLQTLREVYLNEGENENDNRVVELIQELGKLKQPRELVLLGVRGKHMSAISSSINEMQQMEKLYIRTIGVGTVIDMHLNSPLPMLQNLRLDGKLEKLPEWIPKLQNLVKLTMELKYSKLTDDLFKSLKSMPNLLSLYVSNCDYEDEFERLHFQDGWFKNLRGLYLQNFDTLSCILIDEGALCSFIKLKSFVIPELNTLPTGIQHLQKLEVLRLENMSVEFMHSIAPVEGKEHWIFKQVPFVETYG